MSEDTALNPVELATELTIAWLSNPNTRATADEVPAFLAKMHQAVNELATPAASVSATVRLPLARSTERAAGAMRASSASSGEEWRSESERVGRQRPVRSNMG